MRCEKIHLKDIYPFLGENDCDSTLEIYLPHNYEARENQKRPCILLCPGGGYSARSHREDEVVAAQYLAAGFATFILHYSVGENAKNFQQFFDRVNRLCPSCSF